MDAKQKLTKQELADYFGKFFTQQKNHKGNLHITCELGPQALREFICDVHTSNFANALPDDWIFATISDCFERLSFDEIDDIQLEADPYYSQLYEWFGNSYAHGWCNEYLEQAQRDINDIYSIISGAQELAMDCILHRVNDFLEESLDDGD